jgi:hypothetical protein
MMREPCFPHHPVDLGLAGKVGNVQRPAADRFYVGQRRPDKMFDAGVLGSAYRRRGLLKFVGAFFPIIGDKKNALCPFECGFKGFRAV